MLSSVIMLGSGCKKEPVVGSPYVDADPKEVIFDNQTLQGTVNISSNREWAAQVQDADANPWIQISPASGSGDGVITIAVLEPIATQRQATIKVSIKGGTDYVNIDVSQAELGASGTVIYKETFGAGVTGQNVDVGEYTEYDGTAKGVTYSGTRTTVRIPSQKKYTSDGCYTGASGVANVFFGAVPATFTVSNIALDGNENFTLGFGLCASNFDPFAIVDNTLFSLSGSVDGGVTWKPLDYTVAANTAEKAFGYATMQFKVAPGSTTLSLRFIGTVASSSRIDDILLTEGGEGTVTLSPGTVEDIAISALRAKPLGTVSDPVKVTGVVMSDRANGNMDVKSLIIQDGTSAGNGISVRTKADHQFDKGDKVEVICSGGTLSQFQGMTQIEVSSDAMITKTGTGSYDATVITSAQLAAYESMYVSIAGVQVVTADRGKTMYNGGTALNMMGLDGNLAMYTYENAAFAATLVPSGNGILKGIAGVYGSVRQVIPRDASDFAGLTGATVVIFGTPYFTATTFELSAPIDGGFVAIPFDGGSPASPTYSIDIAVSGEAAVISGIDPVTTFTGDVSSGAGEIRVPITGSLTATAGVITFTISGIPELTTTTCTAKAGEIPFTIEWSTAGLTQGDTGTGFADFPCTSTPVAGITVGSLTRTGTWTSPATGNVWGGRGVNGNTGEKYASFTITSADEFSLKSINGSIRASATGALNTKIQYQVGAGAFADITTVTYAGAVGSTTGGEQFASVIDLSSIAALQKIAGGTVVTIKLIPLGASGATGTWYLMDSPSAGTGSGPAYKPYGLEISGTK